MWFSAWYIVSHLFNWLSYYDLQYCYWSFLCTTPYSSSVYPFLSAKFPVLLPLNVPCPQNSVFWISSLMHLFKRRIRNSVWREIERARELIRGQYACLACNLPHQHCMVLGARSSPPHYWPWPIPLPSKLLIWKRPKNKPRSISLSLTCIIRLQGIASLWWVIYLVQLFFSVS